jgi:hypothetical protein
MRMSCCGKAKLQPAMSMSRRGLVESLPQESYLGPEMFEFVDRLLDTALRGSIRLALRMLEPTVEAADAGGEVGG